MNKITRMLGTGVGAAAEYREHRKEQKRERENSQQDETAAGPSRRNQPTDRAISSSSDGLPAYAGVAGSGSRTLASGKPSTDDKKAALSQYEDEDDEDDLSIVDDEMDWELDEATENDNADGPPSYEESEIEYREDDLAREVVVKNDRARAAAPEFERTPLPCVVILPQRRPRNKARGFVRAYAPLLGECSGISQETFLSFLDNFVKSSQASPAITVIQIAAGIAGMAPSVIAMAVTTAVQIAAGTAKELQSRKRANTFLDKMNEEMFKPAGLYAMIVKYKTEQEVRDSGNSLLGMFGVSGEKVDFDTNQTIAKYNRSLSGESATPGNSRGMSERMKGLRLASGKTEGPMRLPEAAPLIFPNVDKAIAKEGPETFKDKTKDARGFLLDYMDKRAQLNYSRDDPDSMLNVPESQRAFKSKLSDPNHPMYNGGLVGFVSGGYLSRPTMDRRRYHDERRMLRYDHKMDRGRDLSHKQARRYDRISAAEDQYYGRSRGYDDEYGSGGRLGGGFGDRRRRGLGRGPISLVGGLISAAAGGRSSAGGSREYEDAYSSRMEPLQQRQAYGAAVAADRRAHFDDAHNARMNALEQRQAMMGRGFDQRRAFDDAYDPRLGVMEQRRDMGMRRSFDDRRDYGNAPAPHAPYGGQRSAYGNDPTPYGGQDRNLYDDRGPAPYGESRSSSYSGNQAYYNRQRRPGGTLGIIKKVMTEDVLYLMIVNMPSEEELAEARVIMQEAKAAKKSH